MKSEPLVAFFEAKGLSSDEALLLASELEASCPWFMAREEIDDEIGTEMLGQEAGDTVLAVTSIEELLEWHNTTYRKLFDASRHTGELVDPYADLVEVVSEFGREDAFGDGDYWVVSDSFSSTSPSVVATRSKKIPEGMHSALERYLQRHSNLKSVSVIDDDGTLLAQVAARAS